MTRVCQWKYKTESPERFYVNEVILNIPEMVANIKFWIISEMLRYKPEMKKVIHNGALTFFHLIWEGYL